MKPERRIWQFRRQAQPLLFVAVGLAFVAFLLWLLVLMLIGRTVDAVFQQGQTLDDVMRWLMLAVGLVLGRAALMWCSDLIAQVSANRVKLSLRTEVMAKLATLGPTFARGERAGELVHSAVTGIEDLNDYITEYLPARYMAGLGPALVFVLIMLLDPWTLPILLFTGPILVLLLALIGGQTRELTARRFKEMAWMSAHFLDMLQGLPTLKMFGRSKEQAANVDAISSTLGNSTMDVLRTAFQTSLVLEWGATAATALVAIEVSLRLMAGVLPFETALTVLLLTPEFFMPLRQLSIKYHAGTAGKAAAERIADILDATSAKTTASRPRSLQPAPHFRQVTDIRFEQVQVAYDDGERIALNGFDLTLKAGETVALVGETGSGKTTAVNLLLRFVEPTHGSVRVGDMPLSDIDPASWRSQVAWVPQHPHLFHGTIADNLRLAKPNATLDDMVRAASKAQIHDVIKRLPFGYDTAIGEQGVRFSGGQRQRLALARAFLKDAPLLILDEATSHLDDENEAQVQAAVVDLMRGRTVLIVTHRLRLAYQADRIALMAHGRVAEWGTPQSLAQDNVAYQTLVAAYEGGRA